MVKCGGGLEDVLTVQSLHLRIVRPDTLAFLGRGLDVRSKEDIVPTINSQSLLTILFPSQEI